MANDATAFRAGYSPQNRANEDYIENYAYWLGGGDTSNAVLGQYDIQRNGYGRLFIIRMPYFVSQMLPSASKKVKHLLEFANVGIDGIQGYSVEFGSITVGYAGTTVEIPTGAKDDTSSLTIKIYDTAASLLRSYFDYWITGSVDPYLGFTHYNGALDAEIVSYISQAYQTMEAIYVATDPTGKYLQYACLLTNLFPKNSEHSQYNWEPGQHDLTQINQEFTANKIMSNQITNMGRKLLNQYNIIKNFNNYVYVDPEPTRGDSAAGYNAIIAGDGKTMTMNASPQLYGGVGIKNYKKEDQFSGLPLLYNDGSINPTNTVLSASGTV